jgi:hypothetical protein
MKQNQAPQRSEKLLPADDEVAEEVNLDQQSEQSRRVGHAPAIPDPRPGEEPKQENAKP